MKKYFQIYKVALLDMFSDPGKTFIWILVGASEAFVMSFTWIAVSQGKDTIGSMKTAQVVTYYLFTFILWYIIGGTFYHMIADSISSGKL